MSAVQIFEDNQKLVFSAIKQHFGDFHKAHKVASINNMELDDLIQIGQSTLWKLCQRFDPSKKDTFKGYAVTSIKWSISTELHKWGLPVKVPVSIPKEKRNSFTFKSVDLHAYDSIVNDYFAIDCSTDIESKVIDKLASEGILHGLTKLEKYILINKGFGFSDREIGEMLGKNRVWITKRKLAAIDKIKHPERMKVYES